MQIDSGNALLDSTLSETGEPTGWFVGSQRFIKKMGLCQNELMEIKWSTHPQGFDSGVKPCALGPGISVLISGIFLIAFRGSSSEEWSEYRMANQGDYVMTHGIGEHYYVAIEDSVLITVRLTLT